MKEIKLQNYHEPALVDDDFIYWMAMVHNENWYADFRRGRLMGVHTYSKICRKKRSLKSGKCQKEDIRLSQIALNKYDCMIDHKDRNPLNNCKDNLRICNFSTNGINKTKQKGKYTSQYKGVHADKNKWRAAIYINNRRKSLGHFENEIDAAKAYNDAALKYFGEFAVLNTI